MLFASYQYLAFLTVIVAAYHYLGQHGRVRLLFIGSYIFYATWNPPYLILIVGLTLWFYILGLMMDGNKRTKIHRVWLVLGVLGAIGVLCYFKYSNFTYKMIWDASIAMGIIFTYSPMDIILPLGISFYTFQGISYLVDIYRNDCPAERSFPLFATYIAFFPQLVAGPIERASNILPQLRQTQPICAENLSIGFKLILWGLFKKLVLADNLASLTDPVFSNVTQFSSLELLTAIYAFTFQIYFDFSAYSHIAIGSARLLGIKLSDNFKLPYYSIDIIDFWRRWHITLSTWLRDYLYIPLGGSRVSARHMYFNLLITMLLGGLWHGANWTFIVWGGYHGIWLCLSHWLRGRSVIPSNTDQCSKWLLLLLIITTFNIIAFGWILFRAESIQDISIILSNICSLDSLSIRPELVAPALLLLLIIFFIILYYPLRNMSKSWLSNNRITWNVTYIVVIIIITLLGASSSSFKFIYFEF